MENFKRASELPQKVETFLKKLPGKNPIVVVIVEAVEAVAIAEYLKHVKLGKNPKWLVGSLGLDLHKLSAWRTVFHGGLFVEPHMPELAEFKTYFIDALQVNYIDFRVRDFWKIDRALGSKRQTALNVYHFNYFRTTKINCQS